MKLLFSLFSKILELTYPLLAYHYSSIRDIILLKLYKVLRSTHHFFFTQVILMKPERKNTSSLNNSILESEANEVYVYVQDINMYKIIFHGDSYTFLNPYFTCSILELWIIYFLPLHSEYQFVNIVVWLLYLYNNCIVLWPWHIQLKCNLKFDREIWKIK